MQAASLFQRTLDEIFLSATEAVAWMGDPRGGGQGEGEAQEEEEEEYEEKEEIVKIVNFE